jgi:hypothetical protein
MSEAFEGARQVVETDPEKAGTLLLLTTAHVHPFADGNGRTARLEQELLHRGYDGSREDKTYYSRLLTEHEGRRLVHTTDVVGLQPRFNAVTTKQFLDQHGLGDFNPTGGVAPFSRRELGVTDLRAGNIARDMADIADEPFFNKTVLTAFTVLSGRNLPDYLVQHPQTGKLHIDAGRLVSGARRSEAPLLWRTYGAIKQHYVQTIIRCLAYGDERLYGPADRIVERYRSQEYRGRRR